MQIVTTARHGGAQLRHPAETRCCATTSRSHVEKRSDSRRFGVLALHRATFLTSQHVSEAGPSRVQAPVGTAGRVPDAAKRPNSRTRQAFPQTQALTSLDVSYNAIGDEGATRLAETMREAPPVMLAKLNVRQCQTDCTHTNTHT